MNMVCHVVSDKQGDWRLINVKSNVAQLGVTSSDLMC